MNKHVHQVVPEDWGWWTVWVADILGQQLDDRCKLTRSTESNPEADLNFYHTWMLREEHKKTKLDVGHFTHFNPIYGFSIDEALQFYDHFTVMCQHARRELIWRRVPTEKITVIKSGVDDAFGPRPLNVGISGRPYMNYRKREYLLAELWWVMDLRDFYSLHFVFLGEGWDALVQTMRAQGAKVSYPKDWPMEKYPEAFRQFDVYVSTAFAEGGPMGVIQALASGIPVIAPDQGYAHDYGCLHFKTAEELGAHLVSLTRKRLYTQTWEEWANEHWRLFERLWAESA